MSETSEVILIGGTRAHAAAVRAAFPSRAVRLAEAGEILRRPVERPALAFVEWLLPDMAGIELVRRLRGGPASAHLHMTLVLDRDSDEPEARRRAIACGADDYMTGPLTADRLVERLQHLRGAEPPSSTPATLRIGDLLVDPAAYAALWRGRDLPLRINELNLLIHFARRPNRVFTRSELIGALGKTAAVGDERTVDVWVSRLRRSLARAGVPHRPRTVRALGYVMDAPVS